MNTNTLKTAFLLTVLTLLFIAIGGMLGGKTGVIIALGLAVVMNFGSYWFSDKIVLRMYKAQEVTESDAPVLYNTVRKLATRGNLPMPKVYIIPSGAPNAFATGRNPQNAAVAVTNTLMNMLTQEELEGVLAHELAHVHGRDILIGTIAATIAGAIMTIADIFKWGMIFGGGSNSEEENSSPLGMIAGIAMMIIAPIAAMLVQMAVSRSREYLADERGASLCGNPLALASALQKISYGVAHEPMENAKPATAHMFIMNPFSAGGLVNLFSTHPPVEKRIEKLEAMARNKPLRYE